MRSVSNIFWLGTKELRSLFSDWVLLGLVLYSFSLAVISQAQSNSQELYHASIAVVDEDHSELSRRITHAFLMPYFKQPAAIAEADVEHLMNAGKYTFVIDIPPNFQRDVLAGRQPSLQINVDATAMVQAGLGSGYAEQIVNTEITQYLTREEPATQSPVNLVIRIAFNPNVTTAWFASVMGIISSVTMLSIILTGAALVREREHGTMDHLLVMPLSPRDRDVEDLGQRFRDRGGHRPVALSRDPAASEDPDCRINSTLHVRCGSLPAFRNRDRVVSRYGRAVHAAAWPALHARRGSNEYPVRQRDAAREHAALACDGDAGVPVDAFRIVRPGHTVPRRGPGGRMAAVCGRGSDRFAVLDAVTAAVPLGACLGGLIGRGLDGTTIIR